MPQFRAEAGKKYLKKGTTELLSFTLQQLEDPAIGGLRSEDYELYNPLAIYTDPTTGRKSTYENYFGRLSQGQGGGAGERRTVDRPSSSADFFAGQRQRERELRESELGKAQSAVQGIESRFRDVIAPEERERGKSRAGATRSASARGGLIGSSFGASRKAGTEKFNTREMERLEAEKGLQIAAIFDKFDQRAADRIASERQLAFAERGEEQAVYDTFVQEGKDLIKNIAAMGVSFDSLDDEDRAEMLSQTGFDSEFQLESFYNANLPEEEQIKPNYAWKGNNLVAYYMDPTTGEMITKTYDAADMGLTEEEKPIDPSFITNANTGEMFWYDKENPTLDADGNLVMKSMGKLGKIPKPTGTGTGTTGLKLSSTQKTKLAQVFSAQEITDLESAVADIGVDGVLEFITDEAEIAAIKNVFGIMAQEEAAAKKEAKEKEEKEKKEKSEREFIDRAYLAIQFGHDDGTNVWGGPSKGAKEIDKLIERVQSLRRAGYTDLEIDKQL